jgi:GR25 family glycosyltransferase involved in LPS biosynthesis
MIKHFNKLKFHIITLNDHPDRLDLLKKQIDNKINYQIHKFDKNKISAEQGCYDSHLYLYKYMIEQNLPYIIILEDNAILNKSIDENKILNFIDNHKFDVLYLGAFITPLQKCSKYKSKNIYRTNYVHGTTCYVINRKTCEKLINKKDREKAIDIELSKLNNVFMISPLIFHRSNNIKSTINTNYDKIRNFYFNPIIYNWIEKLFFKGILYQTTILLLTLFVILFLLLFQKSLKWFDQIIGDIKFNN